MRCSCAVHRLCKQTCVSSSPMSAQVHTPNLQQRARNQTFWSCAMSVTVHEYYRVLEVEVTASPEDIKKAYRKQALVRG